MQQASNRDDGTVPHHQDTVVKGGERILLMDDEDAIREMAAAALAMFGYHPVVARDGREMLELYRQAQDAGNPFDAVILDLSVPGGMGGKEAVQELLKLDPGAVAIASSGYSTDPIITNYPEFGFAGVVTKPYTLQHLDRALQEILSRAQQQASYCDVAAGCPAAAV